MIGRRQAQARQRHHGPEQRPLLGMGKDAKQFGTGDGEAGDDEGLAHDDGVPTALDHHVGDPPGQKGDHGDAAEAEGGIESLLGQWQMARFDEIGRQPGHAVEDEVVIAKVDDDRAPDQGTGQDGTQRDRRLDALGARGRPVVLHQADPGQKPQQADQADDQEHQAPVVFDDQPGRQGATDRRTDLGAQHVDADGQATLAFGEVLADPAIGGRHDDGFTSARDDPRQDQGADRVRQPGRRRGQAPDHQADDIGPFDAITVDDPAHGNLQGGVRPEEGGVQRAAIDVGQVELVNEGRQGQGLGDIGPRHEGEDRADRQQDEDRPTDRPRRFYAFRGAGRSGCGHFEFPVTLSFAGIDALVGQAWIEMLRRLGENPRLVFRRQRGQAGPGRRQDLAHRAGRGREVGSPGQAAGAEDRDDLREEGLRRGLALLHVAKDARRQLEIDVGQVRKREQAVGIGIGRPVEHVGAAEVIEDDRHV